MGKIINSLTLDNWISILGIGLPLVISLIVFIVKSVLDSKKRTEELRPNVFISYERYWKDNFYNEVMVLKNYGLTSAIIESIEIEPKIKNEGDVDLRPNTFTDIKNYPLAPNQEIRTIIGIGGKTIVRKKRQFVIKYSNQFLKKKYISEYEVDETGFPILMNMGNVIQKVQVGLETKQFNQIVKAIDKD